MSVNKTRRARTSLTSDRNKHARPRAKAREGACGRSTAVCDPVDPITAIAKRLSVATGNVDIGTSDDCRNGIDSSYIGTRAGKCLPTGYASI